MPKNSLVRQNEACVFCEVVQSFAKNTCTSGITGHIPGIWVLFHVISQLQRMINTQSNKLKYPCVIDRLCGLVVRVSG